MQIKICTVLKLLLDERFNNLRIDTFSVKISRTLSRPLSNQQLWNLWRYCCMKYNEGKSQYISTPAMPNYEKDGDIYSLSDFLSVKECKFESITAHVPIGVINMLKQNYGDYMQLPPVEERGKYHERIVFFDPDKPYTEYLGAQIVEDYFAGKIENDL